MSELDELAEAVGNAVAMAGEAHMHTGNAEELANRIAAMGSGIGFGNDPMLIVAASEHITNALGVLFSAATDLEQAQTFITQAREQQ
ncbi:MAG TPA: hypothetical protein VE172_19900 [Stackebrandtia sp.]|jgi:hypothetical protein|uniref:hypothetical protein n=1 Tax=Stackebrandtia sp. TaxID=2023065 RepID=UPI002D35D308|nr:hypothetical protein [Stackebrandtia sp.]HZE41069.1 hypothetical protein [Stackebrandtia sp.]